MSVFTVDLANQPGELARLCEAMAGRGINLVLSAIAREDGGTVAFIADDEAGAREVLDGAGLQYAMRPALTIRMENQPGTGAATFRKLANAGVNADLLLPVRVSDALFFAVICVDDQDKARQALGAQVIPPGSRPVALAAVPGPGPGRSPPLPRSQRHRSYPRDQTTRPAVIPAPGLASTPDGNGSPDSSHRQSQSARRIRSSPPCRFGTAIWHADNEYRLVQIGLICAVERHGLAKRSILSPAGCPCQSLTRARAPLSSRGFCFRDRFGNQLPMSRAVHMCRQLSTRRQSL